MDLNDYLDRHLVDAKVFEVARNYLARRGWFHSLGGDSIDASGPVPFITYPALAMLERIVRPNFKVFEFGSGNSTIWWSQRVAQVVSVDHDRKWIDKTQPRLASNTKLVHRPMHAPPDNAHQPVLDEFFGNSFDLPTTHIENLHDGVMSREFSAYAAEILNYPPGYFDLVVVDGMARVLTAWMAARQLGPRGTVLFDNTNRWQYNAAYQLLTEAGFAKIDFWGVGPIDAREWCTSIFTRDLDLLRVNPTVSKQYSDLGW